MWRRWHEASSRAAKVGSGVSMDTMWCSEPRSGNNRTTYLDELLHARADVEGVHIGVLLGGGIVKLGVRERLWIGGDVGGGHCGVNGGDARGYRVAQIS